MGAKARGAQARHALAVVVFVAAWSAGAAASPEDVIAQVKGSIVAIGTFQKTRTPAFAFRGTGFVVGDGLTVATNFHVLPEAVNAEQRETLVVLVVPQPGREASFREVRKVASDQEHDLALLALSAPALPALKLAQAETVREGQMLLFTGFPIGSVLGPYPATHRAMVAALTPFVIPRVRASQLDARTINRIEAGSFGVLQLDATAYPGNSGSPLYDPQTGAVVGIVNMVLVKGSRESALSQPSGITFAIPARHLSELLRREQQ